MTCDFSIKLKAADFEKLVAQFAHLSPIRLVRQPMRVGGIWECEVAV